MLVFGRNNKCSLNPCQLTCCEIGHKIKFEIHVRFNILQRTEIQNKWSDLKIIPRWFHSNSHITGLNVKFSEDFVYNGKGLNEDKIIAVVTAI